MDIRPAPTGYRPFEVSFALAEGFAAPSVAYRETFGGNADIDNTHTRIVGPVGQFARVLLRFEPLAPGSGFVFRNTVAVSGELTEFVPGVERGIRAAMMSGSAGFPVIDFMATLLDGATHDVDSSIVAFEIASRIAFRKAIETVEMKLLEPVMKLSVTSSDDFIGAVVADLKSRRGTILIQRTEAGAVVVDAIAPCANLVTYGRDLRAATSGQANCSGEIVGLVEVSTRGSGPENVAMGKRA